MARAALARQRGSERLLQAFAEARLELTQALTRFLGSSEDAQDAVQDAFLKCWRRRKRVNLIRNLRAWIFRVALNAARDLQRNVWRQRARPLTDPFDRSAVTFGPGDEAVRHEELDRLRTALNTLRAEERAVFLLRQNSDLTYEQIASRRCVPVGTVKTQMRTALHKLRIVLQEPCAW
jgi:RNA polymerase sigma-70 factor (ECF subfamily)